jgi:hypothetical protein
MEAKHTTPATVLLTGADYLENIIADMERQAAVMEAEAQQTSIPQVREGYERFAEVLLHCTETLRAKCRELRGV